MKTDDLIALLATDVAPVNSRAIPWRFMCRLFAGVWASAVLLWLVLGLNPALKDLPDHSMFWVKFAFPALMAAAAWPLVQRLARPGMKLRRAGAAWVLPLVAMLVLAIWVWHGAAVPERSALLFGQTWQVCSISIASLAMPVFVAVFWALRQLAPTQLRLAGASAGLLAGALGALVYAFHCPELAAPFLLVWNGLGMLLPTALGAALGPWLLRW
jgi:hypothetical protein